MTIIKIPIYRKEQASGDIFCPHSIYLYIEIKKNKIIHIYKNMWKLGTNFILPMYRGKTKLSENLKWGQISSICVVSSVVSGERGSPPLWQNRGQFVPWKSKHAFEFQSFLPMYRGKSVKGTICPRSQKFVPFFGKSGKIVEQMFFLWERMFVSHHLHPEHMFVFRQSGGNTSNLAQK